MSAKAAVLVTAWILGATCATTAGVADPPPRSGAASIAYHLRVVRVAGAAAAHGAALGCGDWCGRPVILPAEEAWGTPAQLAGLARALGGARADAVTGYIVKPDGAGHARFEATVYPGEVAVELRFAARAPAAGETRHDLTLEVAPLAGGEPLAEVRVLAAAERTVAIAAPSPVEGEWIALAVTTLDAHAAEARVNRGAPIAKLGGPITPPQLIEKAAPIYPEQARSEKREARIVLQAVIDAEGAVRAPIVLQVPPDAEDMAAAAVEAVQGWRYRPALAGDTPVPVYFTIVVEFRLQ